VNVLIDFLRLHPVFTQRGIRAAWYLYLLGATVKFVTFSTMNYRPSGIGIHLSYWILFLEPLLTTIAEVFLVRIFLEIALRYLFPRSNS
jgi:hypothetical protein